MPEIALRQWMAYFRIEPAGEQRADLRAGIIASTIANAFRTKGRAFKPSDFMVDFAKEPRKQMKVEDMKKIMAVAEKAFNRKRDKK